MFGKIVLLIALLNTSIAMAKVKIQDITYTKGTQSKVIIKLSEGLIVSPDLKIKDNIIQLEIPSSFVWPKIEKKVTWGNKTFDTTITAYQYNKDLVRFRVILPKSVKGHISHINVNEKSKSLELYFPSIQTVVAKRKPSITKEAKVDDESFLNQLLVQSKNNKAEVKKTTTASTTTNDGNKYFEDKIQQKFSGEEKNDKKEFSFNKYIMKFVAFLGIILLGFYGIVFLMKKGVMKKGRLGFLNSTKMVEVLNTTHIGPKKSVLMIKAHNQVFLVGNSETGLNLISEISDVNGLIKEGEKQVSGTNFESNMNVAEETKADFNLKEVLTISEGVDATADAKQKLASTVKDNVRISDQIKNKMKGLKSFQ